MTAVYEFVGMRLRLNSYLNYNYQTNYQYYIKHSFFKANMEITVDNNRTQSAILKKSHLHETNQLNPGNQDNLENIFLKNINCSYLAQMSSIQVQQQISEKKKKFKHEQLKEDKKCILAQFQEVETFDGKTQYDLKGNWQYFQIVALREQGQKDYELQQKPFLFCCDTNNRRLICKAIIYDSHFQLFCKNPYKPNSQLELFYAINFDTIIAKVELQRKMGGELLLKTQKMALILKPVEPVMEYWFKQLEKNIAKSKGRHCLLTALDSINSFYKKRYQTQNYFTNNCKNGDILLFQDNHFMAKVQRFITRSEYDHVGMVIRDKKHGILIFQSNSETGVCLTPWRYVVKFEWYKSIPKIAWRRLEVDRPLEFDIKLEEFVIKSLPLRFHFSISKLAAQQSFIMVDEPERDLSSLNTNQTNGYFCSELIAKTYKHLGLLAQNKQSPNYLPSSRFYPKDFSQRVQMKLQKGQLMQQREIVFDREILKHDYNLE